MNKQWLEKKYIENKLSTRDIAKEIGSSQGKITYWLRKHGIPARHRVSGGHKLFDDLTGKRFGKLVVLSVDKRAGANCNRKSIWLCQCDCGKTTPIWGHSLKHGLTKSCGCLRREKMFGGHEDLSASYWNRILKGAHKRSLAVEITIEFAWDLYLVQQKKCALSGLPIFIHRDYTRHHDKHTASLDRIDNAKGYTENNVQWLHRIVNKMKGTLSQNEFTEFCRSISNVS